jgi:flagellar basal body-associated protein FliL
LSNGKGEVSPVVAAIVIILVIAVVVVIYVYLMGRHRQPPQIMQPPTQPGAEGGNMPVNAAPGAPGPHGGATNQPGTGGGG